MNMTPNSVSITSAPLPFSDLQKHYQMPEGLSLKEMIRGCKLVAPGYANLIVFVNDRLVIEQERHEVFPVKDDIVSINVSMSGSGGGKDVLRAVALIGVLAFSMWAGFAGVAALGLKGGGAAFGGAAIMAATGIGLTLALNALIPPVTNDQSDTYAYSPSMNVGGLRNTANLYGPVARIFGRHKVYPSYAAEPFTEYIGENLYGRYLFAVGKGSYKTYEMKIGSTDLSDFEDYTVSEGDKDDIANVYPNDVTQDQFSIELTEAAGWQARTTPADTEEIVVDILFPAGLFVQYDSGRVKGWTVTYEVQYAVKDSGQWHHFPDSPKVVGTKNFEAFSSGFIVGGLTAGEYDVRVRKTSPDIDFIGLAAYIGGAEAMQWVAMQSIKYQPPVDLDDVFLIALRIKLTGQIRVVDSFNLVVLSELQMWGGLAWTPPRTTNNPAWAYAEVLRGNSNKKPAPDSKIDGDALLSWANFCSEKGFEFNRIVDYKTTVWDLCGEICSIGRASRAIADNKYSVILDLIQAVPYQHFSPRNSWGFSATKLLIDIPHALKCKFINADSDYVQDEIIVYRDGYNAGNATEFETLSFFGATSASHVWKLARYHFAVALHRPETYEINTDFENIVCKRGSMVRLTHDVIAVGLGQARVKAIAGNDVTIDSALVMEGGKSYGAQIRRLNSTMIDTTVTLDVGSQTTITLGSVDGIAVGNMIYFGELGSESMECVVLGIEPGPELTARIRLANYATEIIDYDGGTVPTYTPIITIPPVLNKIPPPVTVLSVTLSVWPVIRSDIMTSQIHANVNYSLTIRTKIDPRGFEGEYRYYDTDETPARYTGWRRIPEVPVFFRSMRFKVENNKIYDFRIRSIAWNQQTSEWNYYRDYWVSYNTKPPHQIAGLALVQGGSTWQGIDCAITWTAPADGWRVARVKVAIYETSPPTLLRTEYVDQGQNTYTYSFAMNEEDNTGTPVGDLTFRVSALSGDDDEGAYGELVVAHANPSAISGLTSYALAGAAEFAWDNDENTAFSHFEYRINVGSALNGEAWNVTHNRFHRHTLTPSEKDSHGATATVYFEVRAVNVFGTATAAAATNRAAGALTIKTADIDDYQLTPQKFDTPIIQVVGLSLTDDSPSPGYVAWGAFTIYYSGASYSINAGNSNNEFICFKDLSTTMQATNTHPSENWATWDPSEDFIIVWNDGGTGVEAWSSFMNLVASAAFIGAAAIADAHIGTLTLGALTGSSGTLAISSSGKLQISAADGIEIKSGGNVSIESGGRLDLEAGGDIRMYGHVSNPANIEFYDLASTLTGILSTPTTGLLVLRPGSDDSNLDFAIGGIINRWEDIDLWASEHVTMNAYVSASKEYEITCDALAELIQLKADDGSNEAYLILYGNTTEIQVNANNSQALTVKHAGGTDPFGIHINFTGDAPDDNSNTFLHCQDITADRCKIFSDGDLVNHDNSYGAISDVKFKDKITDTGDKLATLLNLKVRDYEFKATGKQSTGFVAQEIMADCPEIVKDIEWNNETVKATFDIKLIPYLVKAVQELNQKFEAL